MKIYETPNIRNVAIVGHGGCGKTTLVSAMLFDMGASTRLGRVEDGTTITDFDADEIERRISLQTAVAWGEWRKTRINLLDAPGYANFLSEARAALRAADAAIVVVDGVAGVEVQTEKVWRIAEEYALPCLLVVNRMDRERASFQRTLESLRASFGRGVVPIAMPLAEEKDFSGVAELETDKADVYADDQSGKFQQTEVPAGLKESEAALHAQLVEMVAEADESLMEEFFTEGNLPLADLIKGLRQSVLARRLFPVLPASSMRNVAMHPILDAVVDLLPSPVDRGAWKGIDPLSQAEVERAPDPAAPLAALVFKTMVDPHAGRISLIRVVSGTLKADGSVYNPSRDSTERVGSLFALQGKSTTPVQELAAGDIGALAKLKDTLTNDTLSDKAHPVLLPKIAFPEPATTFAIEPKSRGDEDKISQSLHRLMEEDPVIRVSQDPQTHELLLSGMGQLHVEVIVGRLRKRYKVEVNLEAAQDPVPGDDQGGGRGPRPSQEADGGPRPVRGLQDPDEAAAPRIRLRVRGRHLRRIHTEELHTGRREGNPGRPHSRARRGLPHGRFPGGALRWAIPRRRLVGALLQDRRLPGVQGRRRKVPARPPRAGDEGRDRRSRGVRGGRDGRPLQPSRPASRHGAAGAPSRSSAPKCRCPRCLPMTPTSPP